MYVGSTVRHALRPRSACVHVERYQERIASRLQITVLIKEWHCRNRPAVCVKGESRRK